MVILQVSAYAGPTGGNHIASLLRLERQMKELGHETIYALLDPVRDYPWCKELQQHATVYFLPLRHARIKLQTYRILRRIFNDHGVSIVHSHFELYDIPLVCTAPKGVKLIWHLHDPIEDSYQTAHWTRRLLTRLQYSLFSKKARLLTVSEKNGKFACQLGFDQRRLHYVPNGLDLSRIQDCSTHPKDIPFLIFCWDPYRKGADLAVAAGDLLQQHRWDFTIKTVPPLQDDAYQRPFLDGQAAVADVNELFQRTRCFLHLSRAEGLSYALLEAVYSGIPVISSDIPENLPVQSCPTVIMVPSEDTIQIHQAMERVLDGSFQPDAQMVARSRQIIEERFSLEKWANDVTAIYLGGLP